MKMKEKLIAMQDEHEALDAPCSCRAPRLATEEGGNVLVVCTDAVLCGCLLCSLYRLKWEECYRAVTPAAM